MTEKYDYLVIGGGSGGIASARRAAEYGAKVAVFEAGAIGGTCVNVGCVPKKVMWNAAHLSEQLKHAHGYGFDKASSSFDWPTLKRKRDAYIERLNGIYHRNLGNSGVTEIAAHARFIDNNTIEADGKQYTAPHILIATGGRPRYPGIEGAELGITSDGFFELELQPKKVAVVGAGYIATELAGVLQSLGSEVSLILRKESALRSFDHDIVALVMESIEASGIKVITNTQLAKVEQVDKKLNLTTDTGDGLSGYDCLIWAIGREPASDQIDINNTDMQIDERGFITTDKFQNTNIEGVYAVGDVSGRIELTPVAIAAGRRLSDRLFDNQKEAHLNYDKVASVIFTHPPIGTVGLSEHEAREQYGDDLKIYTSRFVNMYYAVLEEKPPTYCKLICTGADERIVGLHIAGDAADEIIQGFAVAVKMGATKADFDNTVAIHPTAGEELVTLR